MNGAVHGRNLFDGADERGHRGREPLVDVGRHGRRRDHGADAVARIRLNAEHERADVRFAPVLDEREQPRGAPERDRQNARGLRIERPEMPDGQLRLAVPVDAPQVRAELRRRGTRRLEEVDEPEHERGRAAARGPEL